MVIITTRDTHRLATYSEKELGIGSIASDLFPQMPWVEWGLGQGEEGGRSSWPGLQVSGFSGAAVRFPTLLPWHRAHLGFSSSSIHSQGDGESTANDMDFKEGAEEVAAAQGNHLLRDKGRVRRRRCAPGGAGSGPHRVGHASWILGLRHDLLL